MVYKISFIAMVFLTTMAVNIEEERLLFLLSASQNAIPQKNFKLQSYLNIHMARFADRHTLNLPKTLRNRNLVCPYCCVSRREETTVFKLIPTKKLKRYERRKERNENENETERRNKLVLKCKVCSKSTPFSLVKKNKKNKKEKLSESDAVEVIVKKKKKKKDKSCGLKSKYVTPLNNNLQHSKPAKKKAKENSTSNSKKVKISPSSSNNSKVQNGTKQNEKPSKKFLNPFALQIQQSISKKNKKKLKELQQVLKEEEAKNSVKKTLKDFLNLVSR